MVAFRAPLVSVFVACIEFTLIADALRRDQRTKNDQNETFWSRRRGSLYEPSSELATGSTAPLQTFYVYRVQGPAGKHSYPLENVNVASLGGALWYLHNEIIFTCKGEGGILGSRTGGSGVVGERKFHVTRILRFKFHYRATTPLYNLGMNFSLLSAYDSGKATGPFRRFTSSGVAEWEDFGFTVGCGRIGEFPHKDWPSGKKYPDAIWYSLPGPCPSMFYQDATPECNTKQPGGHCPHGALPTGQGSCTYQYEEAGEIDIDELVGITPKWPNRAAFCKQCGTEGSSGAAGGCGLSFWGADINDEAANYEQVRRTRAMFEKKYPNMPKEKDLMVAPPCDFAKVRYFLSWR